MNTLIARTLVLLLLAAAALRAQGQQLIKYQGRVGVNGASFDGAGLFKFAIVNAGGTISFWSNDGTSTAGSEPAAAVPITVAGGRYSVLLGDTTLPNMAAIPADDYSVVFLRVWFNDGTNGSQLLTPDQRLRIDCATGTADTWQQRAAGAPDARSYHTAVWTGSEMIVWGGDFWDGSSNHYLNDGGRYNPVTNSWTQMTTIGAPAGRSQHSAVWTGSEMIVWGGHYFDDSSHYLNDGGRYNPASNSWTALSTEGAPDGRYSHTAVWTGSEMIVWGGNNNDGASHYLGTGGRYNPAENSWTEVTTEGAPAGRYNHTGVWTGSEMIVWGGFGQRSGRFLFIDDGGRYDPAGNSWTAIPNTLANTPAGRDTHTAVWTGSEMIIWGGQIPLSPHSSNTGGRYSPADDSWKTVSTTSAPDGRFSHTAVWTGREMIVWGGTSDYLSGLNTGGRYDPAGNSWSALSTTGAPVARIYHTAVWTGSEMIVWGGFDGWSDVNDTFSYTPHCEAFRITSAVLSNGNLIFSFPTLTGRAYTLWRSDTLTSGIWTNTGLPALTGTGAALTFAIPVPTAGVLKRFFRVHADP